MVLIFMTTIAMFFRVQSSSILADDLSHVYKYM